MKNMILCGIGGQGTVLASKLLADAAMNKGWQVKSAETIGMAQRGGSVFSHLRIAEEGERILSPMIALHSADLILAFEPGEAVRMLPYLSPDGVVITAKRGVMPVTAALSGGNYQAEDMLSYLAGHASCIAVDTEAACLALGSGKVMNILLLGAACQTGKLGLTRDELMEALKKRLPEKFWDLNRRALYYPL